MSDIVKLAVTTAFFALCAGYVRWCDHIIGPDPTEPLDVDVDADAESDDVAAAGAPDRAEARA